MSLYGFKVQFVIDHALDEDTREGECDSFLRALSSRNLWFSSSDWGGNGFVIGDVDKPPTEEDRLFVISYLGAAEMTSYTVGYLGEVL